MKISRRHVIASVLATPFLMSAVQAQRKLNIETIADSFDTPWAIGFATNGVLVTEREGRLIWLQGNRRREVAGLPEIATEGQGGLLDILVPRDFSRTQTLFLTFAKPQGRGSGTAVLRARFDSNRAQLEEVSTIFEMSSGSSGGRHFGSRIAEASDGTLFVSIGDRGEREEAQNLASHNGTIIRITKTGDIPRDNPFISTQNARPEIWSVGHRNPQGLTFDLKGNLWAHEHGARGGDEINRIIKGANYGWPTIAYGRHYSGRKIGEGTSKQGLKQPKHYWDPSIAPSGYAIYSGKLNKQWRGHHLVGSLKFDYIARLSGAPLNETQQIKSKETSRVRDIREAPDGTIWFLSVGNGTLNRFTPS